MGAALSPAARARHHSSHASRSLCSRVRDHPSSSQKTVPRTSGSGVTQTSHLFPQVSLLTPLCPLGGCLDLSSLRGVCGLSVATTFKYLRTDLKYIYLQNRGILAFRPNVLLKVKWRNHSAIQPSLTATYLKRWNSNVCFSGHLPKKISVHSLYGHTEKLTGNPASLNK